MEGGRGPGPRAAGTGRVDRVSRDDVVAFRLRAHHLAERLGPDGLLEAAGRCGLQNSPPGSALLALNARVHGLTLERWREAVADEKSLLQTWCMRGAPYVVPTGDLPVFTTGVLPPTEDALRRFLPGLDHALRPLDMSPTEAVGLARAVVRDVLSGRRLTIEELGCELSERIAAGLPARRRRVWDGEGPWAPGQTLGEGVVHFCVRVLTLEGVVCFSDRVRNTSPLVLVGEWLGHGVPDADPDAARAELLRRYLRCYGPSTRGHFAAWLGVGSGDVDPWWTTIGDELARVEFGGEAWILTEDLAALRSCPKPEGVRLLPPHDPYTQLRDRGTVLDETAARQVWRPTGAPGTVLADGEVTGTWRSRTRSRVLTITITTFAPLSARQRRSLEEEAEQVAAVRGASSVHVAIGTD